MKNRILSALLLTAVALPAAAQDGTITINHTVKRYLGPEGGANTVSELDRAKYITFHSSGWNDEEVMSMICEPYDVGFGRSFWGPFSQNNAKGTPWTQQSLAGNYPENKADADQNTSVMPHNTYAKHLVATEHPASAYSCYVDPVEAGRWAVEFYKNYQEYVPSYFEPMNEPFVHADEFWGYDSSKINRDDEKPDYLPEDDVCTDVQQVKTIISEIFSEIGRQVHEEPALSNMQVVGYSAAYPAYELNDFSQWNGNMKLFMDIAGDNMDGFSIHLYDGVNITGRSSYRSGSNSEALLDLLEAYGYIKWGAPKPHCATEYGGIVEDYGYYEDSGPRSGNQVMRAISHLMFNYMERQDCLMVSIPFVGDKSEWYITEANNYESYSASMLLPTTPKDLANTEWYLNDKIKFFELWKGVTGDRIEVYSDEADIQVLGFRNESTVFIAIDNLEQSKMEMNLSFQAGTSNFSSIRERSFCVNQGGVVVYNDIDHGTSMPQTVSLDSEGLTMIVATLADSNDGYPTNNIYRTKYYSPNYLQKVTANNEISFPFSGVDVSTGYGKCYARMSLGVDLPNTSTGYTIGSNAPVIKVNGTAIDFVKDWRGYDQMGRDDFFGTFEVPFDISLLKDGDNELTVTYGSSGGYISSMVLQVELYENMPDTSSSAIQNGMFEAASLSNWTPFGDWASISLEVKKPMFGNGSLEVDGKGGVFQTINVEDGLTYEVAVQSKTDSDGATIVIQTKTENGDIEKTEHNVTESNAKYTHQMTVEDGSTTAEISVSVKNDNECAWFDNVNFYSL